MAAHWHGDHWRGEHWHGNHWVGTTGVLTPDVLRVTLGLRVGHNWQLHMTDDQDIELEAGGLDAQLEVGVNMTQVFELPGLIIETTLNIDVVIILEH